MTDKELVSVALVNLPETVSFSEISAVVEELRVEAAIHEGIAEIEASRFYTHAEMLKRIASWKENWASSAVTH